MGKERENCSSREPFGLSQLSILLGQWNYIDIDISKPTDRDAESNHLKPRNMLYMDISPRSRPYSIPQIWTLSCRGSRGLNQTKPKSKRKSLFSFYSLKFGNKDQEWLGKTKKEAELERSILSVEPLKLELHLEKSQPKTRKGTLWGRFL